MKLIKHIALGVLLACSVFCAVLYSSCTKDACKAVTCMNGGNCSGGSCVCDSGVGGTNCQTIYRQLYTNTYVGNAIITYAPTDTTTVSYTDINNTLTFSSGSDTTYTQMQLVYKDNGTTIFSCPITLMNNTSTGSTFTIAPIKGGPSSSYTYTGTGSVNTTSASVSLSASPDDTTKPVMHITLSNCSKQ
jgi:hypothetical protein